MTEPPSWVPPGSAPGRRPDAADDGGQVQPDPPRPAAGSAPTPAPTQASGPNQTGGPWQASGPTQAGAAYPYAGGYPPPPAKPKQTLSVVSFVLGVLGCIPLASIAAIVLGAVALAKERAGRAFAIAGIVLGTLWTVLGVVLVVTDAPQRFADSVQESVEELGVPEDGVFDSRLTEDLAVGDCFDDPAVSGFSFEVDRDITGIDCAQPHDLEIYETFVLDEYTTPEDMFHDSDAECIDKFEEFVGIDYYDSELIAYAYYPSRDSWDTGNRTVTCAVTDFRPTTGTLRGANR
ncbi:MAG: DUF4190 domain-containing protein [Dermatophilaceae bacterium]